MSDQHKVVEEFVIPQEDNAHQNANDLLENAIAHVMNYIIPGSEHTPEEAIFSIGHATIAKMDGIETTLLNCLIDIREGLNDIRESVDCLAVGYDAEYVGDILTTREREIIYRALEGDFISRSEGVASVKETDAALLRFKKLAGL